MSLKGTAMTDKVLRGKITDIHQIEDVNALFAEAERLIALNRAASGRIAYINLLSANWVQGGEENLFSQIVDIEGVTENSKIDLNPSFEQLAIFHQKDIAFVAENEDGVVTVYCIGQKPVADYEMQITITEVVANG